MAFWLDVSCFELNVRQCNSIVLLLYCEEAPYDGAAWLAVTACVKLCLHKGMKES